VALLAADQAQQPQAAQPAAVAAQCLREGLRIPLRDRTTAVERFFRAKPRPVFECLLEGMPELPRPARKRPSAPESPEAASARADGWPNP
jgi:hypothetical protein